MYSTGSTLWDCCRNYAYSYLSTCYFIVIGSTFGLPDLSPLFPHFSSDDKKMSEEEHSYYLFNLDKHTEKVKTAFGSLVFDLQKCLEQSETVEDIVFYLNLIISDEKIKKLLRGCTTIAKVFSKICEYSSFFDFEFLKSLARKFGSRKVKQKLKRYTAMLQDYLKRRIVEFPDYTFDDVKKSEKVYVVKTDKIFKDLTGEDLKKLQYEMNKILGNKMLCLLRVEEGCAQLTFRGF